MSATLSRRMGAEFFGTAFLVCAVVGSGVMAERLSGGSAALALLANTAATGAALLSLILTFGPISGAHLNPVVSVMDWMERGISGRDVALYLLAQVAGGIAGAVSAHAMFSLPLISISVHTRSGPAQIFSEFVATFGLLAVIWGVSRFQPAAIAAAVAAYIVAAYWFTASTSFANPAVTIARCLSDTFAGIRPADVPWFIGAQFCGGFAATLLFRWLAPASRERAKELLIPRV